MLNEIVHHTLGTSLAQPLVVLVGASVVGVGRELDGDIGILIEQYDELVEGLSRFRAQRGFVKVVEDVVDEHGGSNRGQGELQDILLRFQHGLHLQLLLMVEVALAGSEEDVANARFDFLDEGTIATHADFLVRTVVAHHIDQSLG